MAHSELSEEIKALLEKVKHHFERDEKRLATNSLIMLQQRVHELINRYENIKENE